MTKKASFVSKILLFRDTTLEDLERAFPTTNKAMDGAFQCIVHQTRDLYKLFLEGVYGMTFPSTARLRMLSERHAIRLARKRKYVQIVGDNLAKVESGEELLLYVHSEIETPLKGNISRRLLSYITADGMDAIESTEEGGAKLVIPDAVLIQIRESEKRKKIMPLSFCHIRNGVEDRGMNIHARVVRMKDYTLKDICELDKLVLLPFYFVKYEKDFEEQVLDSSKVTEIQNDLDYIQSQLDDYCANGILSDSEYHCLITGVDLVLRKMGNRHKKELEEVLTMMEHYYVKTNQLMRYEAGVKTGYDAGCKAKEKEFAVKLASVEKKYEAQIASLEAELRAYRNPGAK